MKPALAFRQPHHPNHWHELPNGDVIRAYIDQALAPWLPKFFGYHFLKIGALSSQLSTQGCSIKHQFSVGQLNEKPSVIADVDDLPFIEHSVDVSLLSHALEFSVDPHHVLREASRVLIPNGYLVVTGFNPVSLAGLNRITPLRRHHLPWNEHFFTPMRVKDWLQLMGFEILDDIRGLHTNLVGNVGEGAIGQKWQRFADNYLRPFGSVYVIVAKKRVLPLTPIKPKWKVRPSFQPVKVTTMNGANLSKHQQNDTNDH
ncbi:class I SAM-dependent methyltransferase [Thalassotalea atypica]|uniref:class I SAM-dependent methyltransferase n=1 Tax=Thalassotalea atypica TaxID=2054316 RepID=UPI002572F0D1|nr:class I SAM-dependent methyltransferase [Thalassotalea atypica]